MCIAHYSPKMPVYLGEFEQLVLLAVVRLRSPAHGAAIRQVMVERAGRRPSFGALYSTLRRLETKGLIRSHLGDATPVRGGRAKKYVEVTAEGMAALRSSQAALNRLAEGLVELGG